MNKIFCTLFLTFFSFLFTQGATAGTEPSVLLQGGRIFTITGPKLKNADILISNGKIDKIGHDLSAPKGVKTINLEGKVVMPGLVMAEEISGFSFGSNSPPEGIDVYSTSLRFALSTGITSIYSNGHVIKMTYGDPSGLLLSKIQEFRFNRPSWRSRHSFRQNLLNAREYLRKLSIYENAKRAGKKAEQPKTSRSVLSYAKLINGKIPIRAKLQRSRDILHMVSLAREFNLRIIFEDAVEAWSVAEEIGRINASVLFSVRREKEPPADPDDSPGSSIKAASVLRKAGVPFALLPPSSGLGVTGGIAGRGLTSLMMEAAFAVRGGLDEDTALSAITLEAARILGVAQRVGSIEEGKDADLIVLDGDPLHWKTFVTLTIINGKVYYDRSKDDLLPGE